MFSLNNKAMDRRMISIVGGRVVVTPASNGSVWMSKHQIADLFGCFVSKVGSNIAAILKSGVFDETKVCRHYRFGNGSSIELYNLEMIAALAFRINSQNADVFRRWLMQKAIRQTNDRPVSVVIPWCKNTVAN